MFCRRRPDCKRAGRQYNIVSPDGSDDNNGIIGSPVKTINKSIELAGKTEIHRIIIMQGTYNESDLNINSALDISAYGNVVIDASNRNTRIFNIDTKDSITISGIVSTFS